MGRKRIKGNGEEGKEKKRRWRTTEDEDEKKGRTKEETGTNNEARSKFGSRKLNREGSLGCV